MTLADPKVLAENWCHDNLPADEFERDHDWWVAAFAAGWDAKEREGGADAAEIDVEKEREEWTALAKADTLHMLPTEALIASIRHLAERLLLLTGGSLG